jgi:hypothetical protein
VLLLQGDLLSPLLGTSKKQVIRINIRLPIRPDFEATLAVPFETPKE